MSVGTLGAGHNWIVFLNAAHLGGTQSGGLGVPGFQADALGGFDGFLVKPRCPLFALGDPF
jgi:hypothetical protein